MYFKGRAKILYIYPNFLLSLKPHKCSKLGAVLKAKNLFSLRHMKTYHFFANVLNCEDEIRANILGAVAEINS